MDGAAVVPPDFVDADISVLIEMIASMLEKIIHYNDQLPLRPETITRFHSRTPPSISVYDYLKRIAKFAYVDKCCLLMILIYIDRICERSGLVISTLTVHRIVIATVVVAIKAVCDNYHTNTHYAKVGGLSIQELNALELEALFLLDWQLIVTPERLQHYYTNLVRNSQRYCSQAWLPLPLPTNSSGSGTSTLLPQPPSLAQTATQAHARAPEIL